MWPFANRGARSVEAKIADTPVSLPKDLSVFIKNDACIKLWLPEKLTIGLDQLSATKGMSRPDVLRWLFFDHVYGRPALEMLTSWKKVQDELERVRKEAEDRRWSSQTDSGVKFSPCRSPSAREITIQMLGKSMDDFKLWLPSVLKVELEKLAKLEGFGLSDYLRKTLVRQVLGESFHHKWRNAIGRLPDEAKSFEAGSS